MSSSECTFSALDRIRSVAASVNGGYRATCLEPKLLVGTLVTRSCSPARRIEGEEAVPFFISEREDPGRHRCKRVGPTSGRAPTHEQCRILIMLESQSVTEFVSDDVS
jgi:hypothetical protein